MLEEQTMRLNPRYIREHFADSKVKTILLWIVEIGLVIGLAAILSLSFCQTVVMQEGSMDPTLGAGDKFLVNKAVYQFGKPDRGDIVAFRIGDEEKGSTHIKRVIGLPGDTIQIQNGQILINEETYVEQKNFAAITNGGVGEDGITLDGDEYFLLGDNRNSSEDSRFANIGNIKKEQIIGKLWFVISPLDKLGFVES
jgi:signal peptidase I